MRPLGSLKQQAKDLFIDYYWPCVGASFVAATILAALSVSSAGMLSLLLIPIFTFGKKMFFLTVYNSEKKDIGYMFSEGIRNYGHKLGGYLWSVLFTFLWSLLFIIPGIIKSFSYAMTPYLLSEYDNIPARDALKVSMRMMKGNKGRLFVLYLSFIGWDILSILTLGILNIFLVRPYKETALSGFYQELKIACILSGEFPELIPEEAQTESTAE